MPSLPNPHETPTLTVEQAGAYLGLGRTKAYSEARRFLATDGREGLPVIAFGRSLRVPTARLLALVGLNGHARERLATLPLAFDDPHCADAR